MLSQIIFVIQQEFFETCPRDIHELDFGFLGSPRGLATFGDILSPRSRRLHHLIFHAMFGDIAVTEINREVIDQGCGLVGLKVAVTAVSGD